MASTDKTQQSSLRMYKKLKREYISIWKKQTLKIVEN